jgi:hypothetical protein
MAKFLPTLNFVQGNLVWFLWPPFLSPGFAVQQRPHEPHTYIKATAHLRGKVTSHSLPSPISFRGTSCCENHAWCDVLVGLRKRPVVLEQFGRSFRDTHPLAKVSWENCYHLDDFFLRPERILITFMELCQLNHAPGELCHSSIAGIAG